MRQRTGYNPKRRIAAFAESDMPAYQDLAARAGYGGNPEHKSQPSDYGLTPPVNPRPGKTLCDRPDPAPRTQAISLLREGLRRGMVSPHNDDEWPKNVWAVARDMAFEAQLENASLGSVDKAERGGFLRRGGV